MEAQKGFVWNNYGGRRTGQSDSNEENLFQGLLAKNSALSAEKAFAMWTDLVLCPR